MKRVIFLIAMLFVLGGCASHRPSPTVHSAPKIPERIVSIAPSVTEMLFAIGAGGRVVATDDYSDYPAQARSLPHVGGMTLNYEKIVSLKPDLVVGVSDLQGSALAHLDKLGLRTLALDTTSFAKTVDAVRTIGTTVGCDSGATRVTEHMSSALRQASQGKPVRSRSVLIVVEATPKIYVAGKGTFMDDLLKCAGAGNAVAQSGFQMVSIEGLISLKPDLIVTTNVDDAKAIGRLLSRVVHKPRILTAPRDSFVRPGPRLADGLTWLAGAVREPVPAQ